ncbi:MFS transporter [Nocardioides sp. DS6]|uniref:MFS transporter n=1 Tax=Nocardioides eburneus TaxID=3231482 RepID=A0ABV3ST48_9ACTN
MTSARKTPSIPTLVAASSIGTAIEWYDYYIFGTAAALVFGTVFFPHYSAVAGTLASFATYAVGFVARPIGAAVVGHYGDRLGRKSMLVLTLLVTGGSTFLIGVVPTYAKIGLAAPLLLVLLRLIQGFAVGGEWGGAVLISSEHASPRRRAFYGSFAQFGVPLGVLTSNLAFLIVSRLNDDSFTSWGWRIPFLLSAVLVAVGFVVRRKVDDGREFTELKESEKVSKLPFADLVKRQPRNLVFGGLAAIAPPLVGYTVMIYMLTYGTAVVGYNRTTLLTLILLSTGVWILAIVGCAMLSDRYDAKAVYVAGVITAIVWPFPMFALVNSGNTGAACLAFMVAAIVQGIMAGAQGGLFTEIFHPEVRYSAISVAYQFGGMVGGAVTPLLATALYDNYHSSTPIVIYMIIGGFVSLVGVLGLKRIAPTRAAAAVPGPRGEAATVVAGKRAIRD